jgi:hypothetical protein
MIKRTARERRGDAQRAYLRNLVIGENSVPGLSGITTDIAALTDVAVWWARQKQFGPRLTGPAQQLAVALGRIPSSPNPEALRYEFSAMVLSYAQLLAQELGRSASQLFPAPAVGCRDVSFLCPLCARALHAKVWQGHELEFLGAACPRCFVDVTTSRAHSGEATSWISMRLQAKTSSLIMDLQSGRSIAAVSVDGKLITCVGSEGESLVLMSEPSLPSPGSTTRILMLLDDLTPCEIRYKR